MSAPAKVIPKIVTRATARGAEGIRGEDHFAEHQRRQSQRHQQSKNLQPRRLTKPRQCRERMGRRERFAAWRSDVTNNRKCIFLHPETPSAPGAPGPPNDGAII